MSEERGEATIRKENKEKTKERDEGVGVVILQASGAAMLRPYTEAMADGIAVS
jgi:hypothetical protein